MCRFWGRNFLWTTLVLVHFQWYAQVFVPLRWRQHKRTRSSRCGQNISKYSTFIHIYDLRTAWRRKPFVCILCISISQPNPAGHILHITNISLSAIWLTTQSNVGSSIQIHLLFLCASKLSHSFLTLVDGNCSGRSVFWETYVGSPLKSLKMFAQL